MEKYSGFIKDKLIIFKLSKKEQAQIIYLRTDWDNVLVEECWKWNHGQAPPLWLICEIGIFLAAWLNYNSYSIKDIQRERRTNVTSWLGIPGSCLGGDKLTKNLDYFGWVW